MDKHTVVTDSLGADGGGMTLARLRVRRDEILQIAATHDAWNIRVFGSVARGEARPESDVDLLVDLPSGYRGFDYFGALDEMRESLEAMLGCDVDVLSIRGVAPQAVAMADRILREAVPL